MVVKYWTLLLVLIILNTGKLASQNVHLKPLNIGDKVPDILLGEILNHPTLKTSKISDFKGSLLILDFWSTWCPVCISLFPKMEQLQKEFGNRVKILPVGFDAGTPGDIKKYLLSKKGSKQELKLPCLIQAEKDTALMKLFPFKGLPHEVWIDSAGYVIGITDHMAVTSNNIQRILNGENLKFSEKKIRRGGLLADERLLIKESANFGSAFSGYIDSFSTFDPGAVAYKNDSSLLYYAGINRTLYSYYKFFYKDSIKDLSNKKIVVEPNDADVYKDRTDMQGVDNWQYDEFKRTSLFAYEIVMPASLGPKQMQSYMIADFDRFFHLKSKVEKRNIKVLGLVKLSNVVTNKPVTNKEMPQEGILFKDYSVNILANKLNTYIDTPLLIVNKLEDSRKVSLLLSQNRKNSVDNIRKELRKQGLDLVEMDELMDVLVLSRNDKL